VGSKKIRETPKGYKLELTEEGGTGGRGSDTEDLPERGIFRKKGVGEIKKV